MAEFELDIEKRIYESASTLVHRGRLGDRPVIIKTLKPSAAGPSAVARYHHEFAVNQSLTSPYVVRALELTEHDSRILFEDVHANALRELIRQGNLTFEQKLAISIQLCQALQSIHDEGVIHRDINPANVVCNPEAELVRLIDFGLATLAPREYPDATADRASDRHAAVHLSGADRSREPRGRLPHRSVFARRNVVRTLHRFAAVHEQRSARTDPLPDRAHSRRR